MFCTSCGKKLYDGDRFCAHCGAKVRVEAEAPRVRQDVVFNPAFKKEADRRTSEIYRGFAAEPAEEKPQRKTEPANFDWNLEGFPAASKKTEDVDFNWDSVIERRNERRSEVKSVPDVPVVDKIDISAAVKETPAAEPPVWEKVTADAPVRVRESLFVELPPRKKEEDVPELVLPDREEKPMAAEAFMEEPVIQPEAAAEPEEEAVIQAEPEAADESDEEDDFISLEALEQELFGEGYHGLDAMSDDVKAKNTAQLEKFYTYNQKNEAFQELLDQEYERLKTMEDERKPDRESLEYTWAGRLFPAERKTEESPAASEAADKAEAAEVPTVKNANAAGGDTIDFTPIREEARQKHQEEQKAEEPVKEAEEPAPEAEPAEEPETEAAEEAETSDTEEAESAETAEETEAVQQEESSPKDEKVKLRYSDVFPREDVAAGAAARSRSSSVSAARINEAFGPADAEEEEDEPRRMNPFVKFIIFLLIALILLEGAVLAAKIIAPESGFAVKSGELLTKVMDKVTGGDAEDENTPVSGDEGTTGEKTYISDILAEKVEVPESIGQILEDSSLVFHPEDTYAFGDAIDNSKAFENGTWKGDGEDAVSEAEAILKTIAGYYGQWQATNKDTSLIGINKLEIGEIRTGGEGYYVLCRLTFAGTEGADVVEHVTAYVKASQDSMVINDIKEEDL